MAQLRFYMVAILKSMMAESLDVFVNAFVEYFDTENLVLEFVFTAILKFLDPEKIVLKLDFMSLSHL